MIKDKSDWKESDVEERQRWMIEQVGEILNIKKELLQSKES